MLPRGVVLLAADRRGSRAGRRPEGSFPARSATHAAGHQGTVSPPVERSLLTGCGRSNLVIERQPPPEPAIRCPPGRPAALPRNLPGSERAGRLM